MDNSIMIKNILKRLSEELKNEFNIINHQIGMNWNRNIDLSGIEDRLISAVEKGKIEQISLILDEGVANEMLKVIRNIHPIMRKTYGENLQNVLNQMIAKAKDTNIRYSEIIAKTNNAPENDFRTSLQNTQGSKVQEQVPIEEALMRNAKSFYERTGEVPNGYILDEQGILIRDKDTMKTTEIPEQVKKNDDREI